MAKKNFLDNPALRFIDIPQENDSGTVTVTEQAERTSGNAVRSERSVEKKLDELRAVIPEGYRLEKIKEKRTKRLQLVVEPSLYEKMKAAAEAAGISVNEYVIQAVNEKIEGDK